MRIVGVEGLEGWSPLLPGGLMAIGWELNGQPALGRGRIVQDHASRHICGCFEAIIEDRELLSPDGPQDLAAAQGSAVVNQNMLADFETMKSHKWLLADFSLDDDRRTAHDP